MIKIRHGTQQRLYYALPEAAQIITHNQWSVPVQGIHSETLRRTYRDSGRKHGRAIGRDVFFTVEDLEAMGYRAMDSSTDMDADNQIVELVMEE